MSKKDRIPFLQLKKELSQMELKNKVKVSVGIVLNGAKFVNANIKILEANSGKPAYMPYYENLLDYYYAIQETPSGTDRN